jgi:hypothetical protein
MPSNGGVCGALCVGLAASVARYMVSHLPIVRGVDVLVTGPLVVAFAVVVLRTLVSDWSVGDNSLETRTATSRMRKYLVVAPLITVGVWPACSAIALRYINHAACCRGYNSFLCAGLAFVGVSVAAVALHIAAGAWGFSECNQRAPASLKSTALWRTTLLNARVVTAAAVATPCVLIPLAYRIAPSAFDAAFDL